MFLICVRTSRSATEMEKITREGVEVLKTTITIMGNDNPAVRELRDTYFVMAKTTTNIRKQISVVMGSIASTIPTSVDTPLPPLKPAYTGKMCPSVAAIPSIS
jgi:hypothetical protein